MSSIPSYLQTVTNTFYGLDQTNVEDIKKGTILFRDFLSTPGLDPVALFTASTPEEQEAFLGQYLLFLQKKLGDAYQVESLVALSPEELKRRNILFETFSIVLKMLDALQQNMREISQAMIFYTKLQEQYTLMMTKVPLYTPGVPNKILANILDFGKTKLGYGNITVEDLVKYFMYGTTNTSSTTAIDSLYQPLGPFEAGRIGQKRFSTPGLDFQFDYTVTALPSLTRNVQLTVYAPGGNFSVPLYSSGNILLPELKSDAKTVVGQITANLTQQFQTLLDTIPDLSPALTYLQLRDQLVGGQRDGIPWSNITQMFDPQVLGRPLTQAETDSNAANARSRGEINGKLQLQIENARSLRQHVKDQLQPIQDLLSQVRESIQNQSNLLNSIVESMKGIIASIFR